MKRMRAWFFVLLILAVAAPAAAWGPLNDSQEPGSVLVFHKFIRGTNITFPKTLIEISVTCPNGATYLDHGQAVNLRAHWVCPGDASFVCNEVDFNLSTTVNGTIVIDPENFTLTRTDDVPPPPCNRGYLIVWVVDGFGNPISFDGLIGDAVLHDSNGTGGFQDFFARAYNALPIQSSVASGQSTVDPSPISPLVFDGSLGTAYQSITGTIFGTVRYDSTVPTIQHTFLTLLTLDVLSNRPNNPTFVDLNFYNESEVLKSTHTSFVCWQEVAVTSINPTLTSSLFGNKGLVKSTRAEKVPFLGINDASGPVTLVGIVETVDNSVSNSWAYLLYNDSQPVPTTFVP